RFGDSVWYALSGDHASKIAKIFNDTTLDRKAIDDFYGDWLLSPSVKLGDLPFFAEITAAESKATKSKNKAKQSSKSMWEQTVAEFIVARLDTAPVSGDTVEINNEWALVIKEVGDKGKLRAIGLKHEKPASSV
ncbi:MAG: potassium/proton antiporter, partial [Psychrobacter sp.]